MHLLCHLKSAGYDSAVDGNTKIEVGVVLSDENGNALGEVVGGADVCATARGWLVPEMSAEEDRLWSIVKANSLDFDAWIALLDETEKVAGYADHEARLGFMDKVMEVYERAVLGVTYSVDIWLHYCIFAISMYEDPETIIRDNQIFTSLRHVLNDQNGDIPGARAAYRVGNLEDAFSLYEQAIAIEKGKELPLVLPAFYAQYAQFIYLTSKNLLKARKVLVEALQNAQFSKPLLEFSSLSLSLIHLETLLPQPKQIDYLDSLVDYFILTTSDSVNTASAVKREELSCIVLEFLGIFGDAQSIKKAVDRHAKFFLPHSSKLELKKNDAEDYLSSDREKIAKPYSDGTSPPQSLMGAYTRHRINGLLVMVYSLKLGHQSCKYRRNSGLQALTNNYTCPQVPTSVAQGAVYGAYPPTYPTQAYPQQSYAQPAVAATLTPVQ
ncbi:PRE-MRNA PROCESSING PROTEIN PRP39-RELATED [Salix purpurea]|uniref:PRE-MRNA PROCESSING PROTEIN PRP39-RELATED n=1 Tax=Salix purpurea TaxID=77065 RepID=A0A9Q0P372_SALPP|nr:PRE-MRNA PROCESSING PROTEIN PRP39-RELATED [Salix purpurea]